MTLSYRNKLILAGAGAVLLAALVLALLVVPQFQKLRAQGQQIAEAEQEISQAQTLLAQRQEIKARSAETEAKRLRLANQMPESPELASLIIELQDTVNEAGLEFASLTPQDPAPTEAGYSEITIAMAVRGAWQDTVDLLQRLPRLTRQVRVVGYTTAVHEDAASQEETPPAGTEKPNVVETVVTLRVYTMPGEIAPPSTPPAPDAGGQQ
ncbi:MAG TPA: type 4a pilus biogenesis protein PilO [Coriobacteriia bacterium]|nr:type 4a pilus biogenesis protein PilO [Coriobacteriia bacterium]